MLTTNENVLLPSATCATHVKGSIVLSNCSPAVIYWVQGAIAAGEGCTYGCIAAAFQIPGCCAVRHHNFVAAHSCTGPNRICCTTPQKICMMVAALLSITILLLHATAQNCRLQHHCSPDLYDGSALIVGEASWVPIQVIGGRHNGSRPASHIVPGSTCGSVACKQTGSRAEALDSGLTCTPAHVCTCVCFM